MSVRLVCIGCLEYAPIQSANLCIIKLEPKFESATIDKCTDSKSKWSYLCVIECSNSIKSDGGWICIRTKYEHKRTRYYAYSVNLFGPAFSASAKRFIPFCFVREKTDIYGQTNGSSSASMPPQTIQQPPVAPPPVAPPPPFNAGKFFFSIDF